MEKDIGKIKKNEDTDIVVRIDDFGGKTGLTIREFVNKSESGFTGFTKSGVRIQADSFDEFKKMINSINPEDLKTSEKEIPTKPQTEPESAEDENTGINEEGLM